MATKTRAPRQSTAVAPDSSGLPSALALLTGLNDVARSLVPMHADDSSLHQVAEGTRRLLRPDGIAILVRSRPGECVFRFADGALADWDGFALSGVSSGLMEALFLLDTVTVFHRKQRSPWTREFLFSDAAAWGAIAPIRAHGENLGALLINHATLLRFRTEHAAGLQSLA
ncbi:MAG: hypothetical protein ACRD1Z_19735, partial [Vicinamibacteria bacterium]